jgi:chaperone required for assembly of F1-ATPase
LRYFPTDSALFFTEEGDRILHTKQRKHLQPVIRWLNRQLNLSLEATTNMSRIIDHSPETIETIRRILASMVSEVKCLYYQFNQRHHVCLFLIYTFSFF